MSILRTQDSQEWFDSIRNKWYHAIFNVALLFDLEGLKWCLLEVDGKLG